MPLYDYRCEVCGRTFEAFHKIAERTHERCCNKIATVLVSCTSKPICYDYFDNALDCHITGPKQRAKLMKKGDLADA